MSTAGTTEWELRLKDYVSAPFDKIVAHATGAQKKINDVNSTLGKAAQASVGNSNVFKRSLNGIETSAKSLKSTLSAAASEIPGLSSAMNMLANPAVLLGAGVFALGVGLKKSATLALDYETGMAKINATAQLSSDTLSTLKNRLVDIGSASGGNFELIPAAYEKILSQTGKVNLSLDILETAVKGAKAGFTDIDTLSSAVAQSLSSIGAKNASAAEVLDTFMMAKKVGAGEFKDFAQYLPTLIASGKNLAISYKDTAGMFAFMTGKGQSAADSAMLMANAFTALQKGDVIKGLEKKGIKLFNAQGMRRNINEVFQDLSKRLDGMNDRQKAKFFIDIGLNDAQAKTAFSVLTSESKKLNDTMLDVNHAFGETDRQLAMTANRMRNWGDIGDEIKSWGVAIGDFILPVIDTLVEGISGIARDMKGIFTGELFSRDANAAWDKKVQEERKQWAQREAYKITQTTFGDKMKFGAGSETNKFYDSTYNKLLNSINGNSKNNIDKKESAAEQALKNVNSGKAAGDFSDKSKTSDLGTVTSDGNKVRNLTMNITMNNTYKAETESDIHNIQKKLTDAIVDSARDAMVTIGV